MPRAKDRSGLRLKEVDPHEWVFEGPELTDRDADIFDTLVECLHTEPAKAATGFRKILRRNPLAIDVRHHLAIAVQILGDDGEALEQWTTAVGTGLKALPPGFFFGREKLPWGWMENRPFLRAYHGLALALMEQALLGEAGVILANLLDLNPGDNQGIRMLSVRNSLELKRPADVLVLCERYPGGDAELMFGKALALFQLGRGPEAAAAYLQAAAMWPKVHSQLVATRHTPPKVLYSDSYSVGGDDEAFIYWEEYGELWKGTPGAINMARGAPPVPAFDPRGRPTVVN